MQKPHFTIKNKFQKRPELYQDLLTEAILSDVCVRITGRTDHTVTFDYQGPNKGRLATLVYNDVVHYISFSETEIKGRNSALQSVPTAVIKYHQEVNPNKTINFYFLASKGNIETDYFKFIYRLMKTAGINFLNEDDHLRNLVNPYNDATDIVLQRDYNRKRNQKNASSYATIDENGVVQIFGKTYGANKYETTLLCLALYAVSTKPIELYEIQEGGLKILPKDARSIIRKLGIIIVTLDAVIEIDSEEFIVNDSLRSPTYIYNLLDKLGEKNCMLCNCKIPQIIQGAHIWPVASIKAVEHIDLEKKIEYATDGDNGLWLCNNHHKLYDINILYINGEGRLMYHLDIQDIHKVYLESVTSYHRLPQEVLTPAFIDYLEKRNQVLNQEDYAYIQ